ncbi:hypothetical protein [Variovorax boronicumulans]|uniref:hypothetical protein n=1 Tax=Variovorax boronicumulans TaxID=436515 RepID=UPI0007825066|nr:hypothetical protein [Variovorax boronicumulans]
MFDYTALKKSHHSAEWFGESEDGVGLLIRGADDSPDANGVAQAEAVVAALGEIQAKAVAVADSFMKDPGDWSLSEIDVGLEAQRAGCDYIIRLAFDPRGGSGAYGYTQFSVHFRAHQDQPSPNQNHPFRLAIEFQ